MPVRATCFAAVVEAKWMAPNMLLPHRATNHFVPAALRPWGLGGCRHARTPGCARMWHEGGRGFSLRVDLHDAKTAPERVAFRKKKEKIIGTSHKKFKLHHHGGRTVLYQFLAAIFLPTDFGIFKRRVLMALDRILVVGKDALTQQLLRPYTAQLFAAEDSRDLPDLIESTDPQAIFFDPGVPHDQVERTLTDLKGRSCPIPAVILADKACAEAAEFFRQSGALDYVHAQEYSRLGQVIDLIQHGEAGAEGDESRFFSTECPASVAIVGKSPATDKSLRMIRMVAKSNCNPVLIVGETGTGKELAALAVHVLRHGANSTFVALNCAALTATLLESELFGHVKGSFTSADRDKVGLLEVAGGGAIFLDEISEMPLDLQAKLLRVVQEKTFRKVGGTADIPCRATIIASSNQNLHKAVEENKFRRDLYYRLSLCPIVLAPLRTPSRRADILLLAEYFIEKSEICPDKKGRIRGLTALAQEMLLKHSWPGNVRELRNVIERAILLETGDRIGTASLLVNPEQYIDTSYEAPAPTGLKDFSLERAERELVTRALQEAGWQKTRAAALLGITRATLYAKVKQYNLTEPRRETALIA